MINWEIWPWALIFGLCAGLAVWGRSPGRMAVHWITKPLPVGLLIILLLQQDTLNPIQGWILAGLVLSLGGDVALMLPERFFVAGLVSFLGALVAYGIGFSVSIPWSPWQLPLILIPLGLAVPVVWQLWPRAGRLRPAVLVYVVMMVVMVWRLLARLTGVGDTIDWPSYVWGGLGGLLFLTGDSLLALRRFARWRIPYIIELGPYFLAQWCLIAAVR